jgi:hypothetical protein
MPYTIEFKVEYIFEKLKLTSNQTLFEDDIMKGTEFQVTVVWHQEISPALFSYLITAEPFYSN